MKVVSLFSGAGGLDLGLLMAGHEVIWANDNYKDAVETYKINIGDHIELDDIQNVSSSNIPDSDLVVGGFPCQGFSIANMNRTVTDTRNKLYLEMLRVISDKRPKYFLAENVPGILTLGNGKIIKDIIANFEAAEYNVKYAILNAADYGVPQSRRRVFILGTRKDLRHEVPFPPIPTHAGPSALLYDSRHSWVTVGQALNDIPEPEDPHDLANHTCSKYKLRFNGYIGHRRIDPDKPAPTITARGDDKGGVVVIHHPRNHRRMTARELATIQSFPREFVFYGCRSSAYRQIANSVPPLLAMCIGKIFNSNQGRTKGGYKF